MKGIPEAFGASGQRMKRLVIAWPDFDRSGMRGEGA
jgi:hypothetical protein